MRQELSKLSKVKKLLSDFPELARSYTREAIETLVELMRSGNDERVRGTAAQALLDRGCGKPKVEVVSDEAGYIQALRAVAAELDEMPDNRLV